MPSPIAAARFTDLAFHQRDAAAVATITITTCTTTTTGGAGSGGETV